MHHGGGVGLAVVEGDVGNRSAAAVGVGVGGFAVFVGGGGLGQPRYVGQVIEGRIVICVIDIVDQRADGYEMVGVEAVWSGSTRGQ